MSDLSSGAALRSLQQAQAKMKKARQALALARKGDLDAAGVLQLGWESLLGTYQALAAVPLASASEDVMTRQIAVSRYATALLVRLRRLARKGPEGLGDDDDLDADEDDLS